MEEIKFQVLALVLVLFLYVLIIVVILEIIYFEKTLVELTEGVNLLIGGR